MPQQIGFISLLLIIFDMFGYFVCLFVCFFYFFNMCLIFLSFSVLVNFDSKFSKKS